MFPIPAIRVWSRSQERMGDRERTHSAVKLMAGQARLPGARVPGGRIPLPFGGREPPQGTEPPGVGVEEKEPPARRKRTPTCRGWTSPGCAPGRRGGRGAARSSPGSPPGASGR